MSLREQLLEVHAFHGQLTPELVVNAARPASSPLHSRFEWNDKLAGEAYRREQAHELIRSARVVWAPATATSEERSVRAFHAVRSESGHVYEPAEKVAADPLLRAIVLRDMDRDWQAMKRRYSDFEEFLVMVREDVSA